MTKAALALCTAVLRHHNGFKSFLIVFLTVSHSRSWNALHAFLIQFYEPKVFIINFLPCYTYYVPNHSLLTLHEYQNVGEVYKHLMKALPKGLFQEVNNYSNLLI